MFKYICLILQVLVWIGILMGFDFTYNIIFYISYLVLQFSCPTLRYLFNQQKFHKLDEYVGNIFNSPPKIEWKIECYHYETVYTSKTNSKGKNIKEKSEKKVVTMTSQKTFEFYSWRDVSGPFVIQCENYESRKSLIRLELPTVIEFADSTTKVDYERQKNDFYRKYEHYDNNIDMTETKSVPQCNNFNLIIIDERNLPILSGLLYIVLTIIPFVEIYKYYIDKYCMDQKFIIKKILSTRYSLNNPERFSQWETNLPRLRIYDQPSITFDKLPPLLKNPSDLPTLDEIHQVQN